jgi:hypothetical protein
VQIAAILTVAAEESPRHVFSMAGKSGRESSHSFATAEILGASLLDRTLAKVHELETLPPTILSGRNVADQVLPSRSTRSGRFIDSWEKALCDYVNAGVEMLLLIRVGAYSDVDYSELLQFHAESHSPLTQVYASDGSLDIAIVDATLLRNNDDLMRRALSNLIPKQTRFEYRGYVNRLRRRHDLHRLMQDGLGGRCRLRPMGVEVRPSVWCADDVELDPTVAVNGAVFIGAGSRLATGCSITGPSSIESQCQIDCGTVIDNSLVLQGTYVGMALDVRRSVVSRETIFNLDRNVEVSVSDARLIGRNTKPVAVLAALTSFLRSEEAQAGD